ncbi:TetR/AcrR family transcriptional regulator [Kribbella sp. NPDC051620]|uniref:TetR/AcrR family transcriptional regulator n=1 Tax=Kribbella sp. NPDC051620 TaxID=3364120 RepID=UPI00379181E4
MAEKRRYSSALRSEQTELARRRILTAAGALFLDRGYLGTTLAAIATEAGVSVQTVYNVIGGKPAVLKAVYDVQLAGDDEPIPMVDRPIYQAIAKAPDARQCLALYASLARGIAERTTPLIRMARAQAATGDRDLAEYLETLDGELDFGARYMAGHLAGKYGLREGLDTGTAADILWSLNGSDLAHRLVNERGWGWDRYEQWMAATLADLLVGQDAGRLE